MYFKIKWFCRKITEVDVNGIFQEYISKYEIVLVLFICLFIYLL